MVIADRLRFGRVPAECYLDDRYQPLQRLTRYLRHLVSQLVGGKQVALGYVYLKLSAYGLEQPLSIPFGVTSQVLLEGRDEFADPCGPRSTSRTTEVLTAFIPTPSFEDTPRRPGRERTSRL
jgi:hypothetical protein